MASFAQLELNSDSEDDEDFVPGKYDSGSDSDSKPKSKKRKTSSPPPSSVEKLPVIKSETRDALWESFQASVASSSATTSASLSSPLKKKIKIPRKYRFAGQDIEEMVEVAEDSEEAQLWLAAQAEIPLGGQCLPSTVVKSPPTPDGLAASSTVNVTAPLTSSSAPNAPPSNPPLPARKPPPKRRGTSLASIAAKSAKPKKLTTLEKSKMDWASHLASSEGMKDELEANRKGGGSYLDKVEFLERVGGRLDEVAENSKGKRRR